MNLMNVMLDGPKKSCIQSESKASLKTFCADPVKTICTNGLQKKYEGRIETYKNNCLQKVLSDLPKKPLSPNASDAEKTEWITNFLNYLISAEEKLPDYKSQTYSAFNKIKEGQKNLVYASRLPKDEKYRLVYDIDPVDLRTNSGYILNENASLEIHALPAEQRLAKINDIVKKSPNMYLSLVNTYTLRCGSDGLIPNAYAAAQMYQTGSNKSEIVICLGLIVQGAKNPNLCEKSTFDPDDTQGTLAHEIGHASSVNNEHVSANSTFKKCMTTNYPTLNPTELYAEELKADYWTSLVLENRMNEMKARYGENREALYHDVQDVFQSYCDTYQSNGTDTHAPGMYRIEYMLSNPNIRKAIGCETAAPQPFCSLLPKKTNLDP